MLIYQGLVSNGAIEYAIDLGVFWGEIGEIYSGKLIYLKNKYAV